MTLTYHPIRRLNDDYPRVLSIHPTSRGFGFCIFDAPQKLIEWNMTQKTVAKISSALAKFKALLAYYKPNIVIIENTSDPASRRGATAKKILRAFSDHCEKSLIPIKRLKKSDVKELFIQFDAFNKEAIADQLAAWLPSLKMVRPPKRNLWESQDARMSIFDAAALAIYFYSQYEEHENQKIKQAS